MHKRLTVLACLFFVMSPFAFAGTRLIFPRIIFKQGRWSGIAVVNPNSTDATITLKAYNSDGTMFSGTGVTNPATATVVAGGQYVGTASVVFTPPSSVTGSTTEIPVWVELTSSTGGLTGFFLEGNDAGNSLYGGDLGTFGTDLYLPAVENSGTSVTEISLVNADVIDANITVDFIRADGTVVASKSTVVPKGGAIQGPLSGISAFSVTYDQVVALRIHADRPVICYGTVFRQGDNTPTALSAVDSTVPNKTIYFPQLAVGGGWTTGIGVVNLDFNADELVTLTAYKDDGTLYADPGLTNPVTQLVPKGGYFHTTASALFGFSGQSNTISTGWIKVDAGSPAINGFVEYGTPNSHALVAAQLLASKLSMFSHQANGGAYYTGLAILNTSSLSANVEIFSITNKGDISRKTQQVLKPGQKEALVLPYFWTPTATDLPQNGGSVYVRSDQSIIATQLFGTNQSLANVPPQQVTTVYEPRNDPGKLLPTPALAVIETGKSQNYTATGASGSLDWYVNGIKGGDSTVGTISSGGATTATYTAPANEPVPHTLTIEATAGSNTGGSSVDVVQREQLTGGLTLITAVAYLESANRFFVAQQQLLSGAPALRHAASTIRNAASTANTNISEVLPDQSTRLIQTVSGDTVSKMLPLVDSGNSYLIMAGQDTGSIYRLNLATQSVYKIPVTGLVQPISLALDPITGNLLVADAGTGQIVVIPRSQVLASPAAIVLNAANPSRYRTLTVPGIRGIATDKCTGTVYATDSGGNLYAYLGSASPPPLVTGLDHPGQILVLYRDGMDCSDGLTLAIVESTRISLYYPGAQPPLPTLVDNTPAVRDITFFPKGNPFTPNGEASVGLAEPSSTAGQGKVEGVQVGGLYGSAPPVAIGSPGSGPNEDPVGDTFDYLNAAQFGYSIPDITSVTGSVQGSSSVITVKFKDPVTLGSLSAAGAPQGDGLWVFVLIKTTATGTVQLPTLDLGAFYPFGDNGLFTFDTWVELYLGQASWASLIQLSGGDVQVSAVENTLTLTVPSSALPLTGAQAIVVVGNPIEITDVAPNNGLLSLTP